MNERTQMAGFTQESAKTRAWILLALSFTSVEGAPSLEDPSMSMSQISFIYVLFLRRVGTVGRMLHIFSDRVGQVVKFGKFATLELGMP